jgi:basic membrane protein A and related proteins
MMMQPRFATRGFIPSCLGCAALIAVAMLVGVAGCKRQPKEAPAPGEPTTANDGVPSATPAKSGTSVGLVFDVGGLGDKSFNDAAHRGLQRAKETLGVPIQYIEPGNGSDRESALRQRAAAGDSLVFGIGFIFSDDITKLASQFPKTKFACIDYNLPEGMAKTPDNLVGLRFREHEGSFLVGAIAGRVSKTKKVGFIGGMKIPLIRDGL